MTTRPLTERRADNRCVFAAADEARARAGTTRATADSTARRRRGRGGPFTELRAMARSRRHIADRVVNRWPNGR